MLNSHYYCCSHTAALLWWLVAAARFVVGGVPAQDHSDDHLVARLDYGSFEGAYSAKYNISYWQKIPFAAPPTGENRFRAPQPPAVVAGGTYNSSQMFDECPQRNDSGSEDCLYLGLYGRPWAVGQALRPVVVVFFGGGYIEGSASFGLPPSAYPLLNVSAAADGMVFVYPNYRTNAFGFLPGRQVAADPRSDANAGLLDQQMALKWTKKYIRHFGGDPDQVTIWGQSAGAGSVIAQTIAAAPAAARPDGDGPLFRRALASSPFWSKTYAVDSPFAQSSYDALARMTGCAAEAEGPDDDSLACLKRVDVQAIRNASLVIADSHTYTTSSYTWGPVIDGVFLTKPLSAAAGAVAAGAVAAGAVAAGAASKCHATIAEGWGMYNLHEGENFIPPGLQNATGPGPFNSSTASFDAWLAGYLPGLDGAQTAALRALYPAAGGIGAGAEELPHYNDTYTRAGLVFRDSVLACPAYWMAGAAAGRSWLGEYTIPPATHGSDTYWWDTVNSAQETDPFHYHGYAGAMASFFMTGDPNALKLTGPGVAGVPPLRESEEFVVDTAGFTTAGLARLEDRCAFWKEVAPNVPM
ncbi:carboxylesterase [Xylariaceae sp. FL0804]|nr:carboxylesterase [Xylariaceae sp. FL0804]